MKAGRDGFWLARWLIARGIEAQIWTCFAVCAIAVPIASGVSPASFKGTHYPVLGMLDKMQLLLGGRPVKCQRAKKLMA
jgi:hypothetical protein